LLTIASYLKGGNFITPRSSTEGKTLFEKRMFDYPSDAADLWSTTAQQHEIKPRLLGSCCYAQFFFPF
jgi:hypothetical protein